MTDPKLLLPFFSELPEELQSRAVIAGGAVLDLKQASDVDIFVLNCLEMDELAMMWNWYQERNKISDLTDKDSSDNKAVTFTGTSGRKINVIFDESENVRELLNTFDISASRAAVDLEGRMIKGKGFTEPGEPIVVYYCSKTTPDRIKKYFKRFGAAFKGRRRGDESYAL